MGMVNEVVAPEHLLDRTLEVASELAQYASPTSMAVMKRQVYADMERGLVDASTDAVGLMTASLRRADFKEGEPIHPDA
jgi:enoyl-CoA hydratase/carnithine racemase